MKIVTARQATRYALGFRDAHLVDVEPGMMPVTLQYAYLVGACFFVLGLSFGLLVGAVFYFHVP